MMTRLSPAPAVIGSLHLDVDGPVLDLHRKNLEIAIGGRIKNLAVGDVETGLMDRTFDRGAFEIAIDQADISVGAELLGRIDRIAHTIEGEGFAAGLPMGDLAIAQLRRF